VRQLTILLVLIAAACTDDSGSGPVDSGVLDHPVTAGDAAVAADTQVGADGFVADDAATTDDAVTADDGATDGAGPQIGLTIADGEKITVVAGATSALITIRDSPIAQNGTITIDVSTLHALVASGTFTTANVAVRDTAVSAIWLGEVAGDSLTLTAHNGPTAVGETVIVTLTGAGGNPWVADTGGELTRLLTATRSDTGQAATFDFVVETTPVGSLTIAGGEKIASRIGATSPVITITATDLAQDGSITIDLSPIAWLLWNGTFVDANVVVTDDAAAAAWAGTVADNLLTLTSTGGPTAVGETVTVTLTGATGAPWVADSTSEWAAGLTATRTDTGQTATFNFVIETHPGPGSLSVVTGPRIYTPDGATSVVLTVRDAPVLQYDRITMDLIYLEPLVASGTLTDENVLIEDSAASAAWTRSVAGNILTLTSTGGPTAVGETITVTFTGAANPWLANTGGEALAPLIVGRQDSCWTSNFLIAIDTAPTRGLYVEDGPKITTTDGTTAEVITVLGSPIAQDGTITVDLYTFKWFVADFTPTDATIVVTDAAANATWTSAIDLDNSILTLTSTDGATEVGETVTLTLTGAVNPWIDNTWGEQPILMTATRTDTAETANFLFVIETVPPAAHGLSIVDGATLTATDGASSPVITVTESDIAQDGAITIDVTGFNALVASGTLTDDNVVVDDSAASATWTRSVAGNVLTLTSTDGPTVVGETITVTFTGAVSPWVSTAGGSWGYYLTATRTDGLGFAYFWIWIQT
jgi:hypothetical protein